MPDVFTVFLNEDDDDDDAHRPDPPTPTFPLETNIRDRWASVSNKTRGDLLTARKRECRARHRKDFRWNTSGAPTSFLISLLL